MNADENMEMGLIALEARLIRPERQCPDLLVQKSFESKHFDSQKLLRAECQLALERCVFGNRDGFDSQENGPIASSSSEKHAGSSGDKGAHVRAAVSAARCR